MRASANNNNTNSNSNSNNNSNNNLSRTKAQDRLKSLQYCFRYDAVAIHTAFENCGAWHAIEELETISSQPLAAEAVRMEELLTDSGLLTAPVRTSLIAPRGIADENPAEDGTEPIARRSSAEDPQRAVHAHHAHHAELACSLAYLNFVRWLCGIPPVRLSASELKMAEIVGQGLLPRMTGPGTANSLGHGLEKLSRALKETAEQHSQPISVFHGEGSLVGAMEKSLRAVHLQSSFLNEATDQKAVAGAIAHFGGTAHAQDLAPGKLINSRRGALLTAGVKLDPPPAPLKSIQVLFDLRPENYANCPTAKLLSDFEKTSVPPPPPPYKEGRGNSLFGPPPSLPVLRRPRLEKIPMPPDVDERSTVFGLDAVWGDRRGALGLRRFLLNPFLKTFGMSRWTDTCIFWTGGSLVDPPRPDKAASTAERDADVKDGHHPVLDAVCYPPPGIIPVQLLEGGRVPWTIMPDSTRFQPTSATHVKVWRVKIERLPGSTPRAERLKEVPIHSFAIDCSTKGAPFCVVFWPDLGPKLQGEQFEVVLRGLRGDRQEMTFFHEINCMHRWVLDQALLAEAANARAFLQDTPGQWPGFAEGDSLQLTARRSGSSDGTDSIERVSHQQMQITTSSCDLAITVRCKMAAAMTVELVIRRFAGEKSEVPRAAQVLQLADQYFLIRLKLPMPKSHYELRFLCSSHESPRSMAEINFKYFIATENSPPLLRSVDDSVARKFGYAGVTPEAQLHGLVLLAPLKYRVFAGRVHFLVYVDIEKALKAATQALPANHSEKASKDSVPTTLFSHRLLPTSLKRQAAGSSLSLASVNDNNNDDNNDFFPGVVNLQPPPREVGHFHRSLHGALGQHTQDSGGDIHLDLSMHDDNNVHSLKQRSDLPCLFEGIVTISELDVTTGIKLLIRFPRLHAASYSPRISFRTTSSEMGNPGGMLGLDDLISCPGEIGALTFKSRRVEAALYHRSCVNVGDRGRPQLPGSCSPISRAPVDGFLLMPPLHERRKWMEFVDWNCDGRISVDGVERFVRETFGLSGVDEISQSELQDRVLPQLEEHAADLAVSAPCSQAPRLSVSSTRQQLLAWFKHWDTDGSGSLDAEELRYAVATLFFRVLESASLETKQAVTEAFLAEVGLGAGGEISKSSFLDTLAPVLQANLPSNSSATAAEAPRAAPRTQSGGVLQLKLLVATTGATAQIRVSASGTLGDLRSAAQNELSAAVGAPSAPEIPVFFLAGRRFEGADDTPLSSFSQLGSGVVLQVLLRPAREELDRLRRMRQDLVTEREALKREREELARQREASSSSSSSSQQPHLQQQQQQQQQPHQQQHQQQQRQRSDAQGGPTPERFAPGSRVVIQGLRGMLDLNGRVASVVRFDAASGRYVVDVEGMEDGQKSLRPESLTLFSPSEPGVLDSLRRGASEMCAKVQLWAAGYEWWQMLLGVAVVFLLAYNLLDAQGSTGSSGSSSG
ncbi:unnamed protein product, partial [Polarella glacialis]